MPAPDVESFVDITRGEKHARVGAKSSEKLADALFENTGCESVERGGRGAMVRLSLEGGAALIRTFRRGGVARIFLKESYLFENRPMREFEILRRAHALGLPVPEPLGVCWERKAALFRGRLATREVEGQRLDTFLKAEPHERDVVLARCGEVIRRFHDEGIWHADLQLGNILIEDNRVTLLDFDKAVWLKSLPPFARARNLLRLRRSFAKHGYSGDVFETLLDGYGPLNIPIWLDVLYAARGVFSARMHAEASAAWRGARTIRRAEGIDAANVRNALLDPGETLKSSEKWLTKRVGDWAVKTDGTAPWFRRISATLRGQRHSWDVAKMLRENGVRVPVPVAYVEKRTFGILSRSAYIAEYLEGWQNMEVFARELDASGAPASECAEYLSRLAEAVNKLTESGVVHRDLSGKNIFTADGTEFCFIDLDSVSASPSYDETMRLKNHVQLYDSFCDLWGADLLGPFIAAMTPSKVASESWLKTVQAGQRERRSRQEALWKKQRKHIS